MGMLTRFYKNKRKEFDARGLAFGVSCNWNNDTVTIEFIKDAENRQFVYMTIDQAEALFKALQDIGCIVVERQVDYIQLFKGCDNCPAHKTCNDAYQPHSVNCGSYKIGEKK